MRPSAARSERAASLPTVAVGLTLAFFSFISESDLVGDVSPWLRLRPTLSTAEGGVSKGAAILRHPLSGVGPRNAPNIRRVDPPAR